MISFKRDVNRVYATVVCSPIGHSFDFEWSAGYEWAAKFLHRALSDALYSNLERIRRDAYEAGWKDAKGKKTKATWFSGMWT